MKANKTRRKRVRKPILMPRFGPNSPVLELGLIRLVSQTQNPEKLCSSR